MDDLSGFLLLFFGAVIWNVNTYFILKHLKQYHPVKFKELGEPGMFTNNTPANTITYLKFILTGGWRELNDPSLSGKCYLMPILFMLCAIAIFVGPNSISYSTD
jgi:hypothetical protein